MEEKNKRTIEHLNFLEEKAERELSMLLKRYDNNKITFLSHFVASIFDIDTADMLSSNRNPHMKQARSMLYYAYSYMSGESAKRISERLKSDGINVTSATISNGLRRAVTLIDEDEDFRCKWNVVKEFINKKKSAKAESTRIDKQYKVVLQVPNNVEVQIIKKSEI